MLLPMSAQSLTTPAPASISVVIRTKTDDLEVIEVLDLVAGQAPPPLEIIVIDSGSTARIVAELERRADRLIRIPPEQYSSASALNQAIAEAGGRLIAILSQDARPASRDYLAVLARAFDSPRVAGVYGRQVASERAKHPLIVKDLSKTYPDKSRTQTDDPWFDNCCSMIRADLWRRRPFAPEAVISEDHDWAKWAQGQGYVVKYEASAVVRHSHPRRLATIWERHWLEGRGLARVRGRGLPAPYSLFCCLREIASDMIWLLRRFHLGAMLSPILQRPVKHAALYFGYRKGRKEAKIAP
jgi:rhamnosyltransferase